MPKKVMQQNSQNTSKPGQRVDKTKIAIFSILIVALATTSGIGIWRQYRGYIGNKRAIAHYESIMNKRIYSACGCVDEEGTYATITYWDENDPELKGLERDSETGEYLPIKDRNGNIIKEPPAVWLGEIKHMHIPFIRGFRYSDGYGVSRCFPCAKAEDQYQINICNSKHLYANITISDGETTEKIDIENVDEANPSLVVEIPDQESEEEILRQQAEVWGTEMQKAGAFPRQENTQEVNNDRKSY